MKKYVITFLLLSSSVFLGGYILFNVFVKQTISTNDETNRINADDNNSQSRAQVNVPHKFKRNLKVLSTVGVVEKRSKTSGWVPLVKGDELREDESIKTDLNASANLSFDEESVIEVKEESELGISKVDENIHKFSLNKGQLGVDYAKSGERKLEIVSTGVDSKVESTDGKFVIQNTGKAVSVATTKGQVKLSAKDETVLVGAGKYSIVHDGQSPNKVAPIPIDVMLLVARQNRKVVDKKSITIRGEADPGARVVVNGADAVVDSHGKFSIVVTLNQGKNSVKVVSHTPWGRVEKELPTILMSKTVHVKDVSVRWGSSKGLEKPSKNR